MISGNLLGPAIASVGDLPLTLDGSLLKIYRPAGLKECRPQPTVAADPESGCPAS